MTHRMAMVFGVLATLVAVLVAAGEDSQWLRVTVFLETGPGATNRAEESLVPGGIYSLAEIDRRGQDAIDGEILDRVRFLGESMRAAEDSMRLATLVARQYYLPLKVGEEAVLPIIDLNPRLGIVLTPLRFVGDRVVCKVQFLEPEGSTGTTDFTGEPITLRLKDADLQMVLQTFSKTAQIEIAVDPSVEGKVNVDLKDVPWDQALDLVLRINGLGWEKEDGALRVAPLEHLSRQKRVRTDATINLPRGSWGSATIASRGDAANPTVVLVVESVEGPPDLVAERDGLVHLREVLLVPISGEEIEGSPGEVAVLRGTLTEEGRVRNAEVLAAPSSAYGDHLLDAVETWWFRPAFDEEGRRQEVVVGFGLRLRPQRALAAIGFVEHIGVEISAKPAPSDYPDQYVISVVVTDLDTGQVIGAPRITTAKGQEAKVRSSFIAPSGEPSEFEMQVKVAEDGSGVSYSWTMTTDGKVVSSHTADFEL